MTACGIKEASIDVFKRPNLPSHNNHSIFSMQKFPQFSTIICHHFKISNALWPPSRLPRCWACHAMLDVQRLKAPFDDEPCAATLTDIPRTSGFPEVMCRSFGCDMSKYRSLKFQKFGLRKDALAKVRFLRLSKAKEVMLQARTTEGATWQHFARLYFGVATRP